LRANCRISTALKRMPNAAMPMKMPKLILSRGGTSRSAVIHTLGAGKTFCSNLL
jgi:hypothetical protein